MVVRIKERFTGGIGLNVGSADAHQYFPQDGLMIELEIDHLRIVCRLDASFWLDHPEIRDFRLSSWLDSKRSSGKLIDNPGAVAMMPAGENTYRLIPMDRKKVVDKTYAVGYLV